MDRGWAPCRWPPPTWGHNIYLVCTLTSCFLVLVKINMGITGVMVLLCHFMCLFLKFQEHWAIPSGLHAPYILQFDYSHFSAVAMLKENPLPPNSVNPRLTAYFPGIFWYLDLSTFLGPKLDGRLLESCRMAMLWGGLFAAIGNNKVVNWEWAACGIGNSLTATRVHGKIIKAGNLLHILSSSGMLS